MSDRLSGRLNGSLVLYENTLDEVEVRSQPYDDNVGAIVSLDFPGLTIQTSNLTELELADALCRLADRVRRVGVAPDTEVVA